MPRRGWDELHVEVDQRPDVSDAASAEAREALLFFANTFGEKWKGLRHGYPFASTITTSVNSSVIEAVRVRRLIRALEGVSNVDQLLADLALRNWEHYAAADMALRLAAFFRSQGFPIHLLRHCDETIADLTVAIDDRPITVECSALNECELSGIYASFVQQLMDWAVADLDRRGRIRLDFGGEFEPEAIASLWSTLDAIVEAGVLASVTASGGLTITFDPDSAPSHSTIARGPVIDGKTPNRLARKLAGKVRQLDVPGPSLLVLRSHDQVELDSVALLFERIEQFPAVSALMVYVDSFLPGTAFARRMLVPGVMECHGNTAERLHRQGVFIVNPVARVPLTKKELTPFIKPWNW